MEFFKDKKKVGIIIILVIDAKITGYSYTKNKSKIFKDECMKDIFVEEVDTNNEDNLGTKIESTKEEKTIVVEIKGEVKNPDVYTLNENSIIKDLIDTAGGLTDEAYIANINRAEQLKDHQLIVIANKNQIGEETNNIQEIPASTTNSTSTTNNGEELININTATLTELKTIPGVGETKAQSIIDYRESNGGFKSIEEIMNITGIVNKTLEKLKYKIKV